MLWARGMLVNRIGWNSPVSVFCMYITRCPSACSTAGICGGIAMIHTNDDD